MSLFPHLNREETFIDIKKLICIMNCIMHLCALAQSCLTTCNSMGCSLPGSSLHGVLQARILEWMSFPSPGDLLDPETEPGSPVNPGTEPGSPALQADSLPSTT